VLRLISSLFRCYDKQAQRANQKVLQKEGSHISISSMLRLRNRLRGSTFFSILDPISQQVNQVFYQHLLEKLLHMDYNNNCSTSRPIKLKRSKHTLMIGFSVITIVTHPTYGRYLFTEQKGNASLTIFTSMKADMWMWYKYRGYSPNSSSHNVVLLKPKLPLCIQKPVIPKIIITWKAVGKLRYNSVVASTVYINC